MLFIVSALFTNAQTNVSGGIYANTTWTLVNSPYIVTGNIVLFPGKILTIEPGVTVKFNNTFNIEIRGELIALGTVTDSISFISNTSTLKGAWDGINILNATQNASAWFKYCNVKHSYRGVRVECCGGNNSIYIRNSWFDNNTIASSGYAGWYLPIDRCLFTNNTTAISEADKKVTNCTFINDSIGILCERFEARNCFFQNNGSAIDWTAGTGQNAIIDSCTIINNILGIRATNGTITNNNISNNVIGIITSHSSATQNGIEYYVPIKDNHICNNTQYNVKNGNADNKNITQNCFCATDSAIIESKLLDGYDSITRGLFNYDIYDSTCQNVTQSVYKVGSIPSAINAVFPIESDLLIFPNPFNDFVSIQFDNQKNKLYSLRIYNAMGQKIQQFEKINENLKTIDSKNLERGIYLLQLIQDGVIVGQKKLIKE